MDKVSKMDKTQRSPTPRSFLGRAKDKLVAGLPLAKTPKKKDRKALMKFDKVKRAEFYHGFLLRAEAEQLVQRDGDFLVRTTRKSDDAENRMAITVRWKGNAHHIIPHRSKDGSLFIEKYRFDNLGMLLRFYFNSRKPLMTKTPILLKTPIRKAEWQLKRESVELSRKLGEGAFGEVYLGTLLSDTGEDQQVAVKLCRGDSLTKTQMQEFLGEARLMRNYNHPHVVRLLGVVVESEPLMLVLEYLAGGDLHSLLVRRADDDPPMGQLRRLQYSLNAAAGLSYLHEHSCMHRDIAARNCLIDAIGNVKISDFGLCRQQLSDYKMKNLSKLPVRWLAPEVITTATFSFKSDIWAYGILLWEIFNDGMRPYPEVATNKELIKKHKAGIYRMSDTKTMPEHLKKLLWEKIWAQNPNDRPDFLLIVFVLHSDYNQELKDCGISYPRLCSTTQLFPP